MNDLKLWADTIDWLNILFNVLALVLPTLAGLAAVVATSHGLGAVVTRAVGFVRPALDEATDPAIVALAEQFHTTPEQVLAVMTAAFKALGEPPQEHAEPGTLGG